MTDEPHDLRLSITSLGADTLVVIDGELDLSSTNGLQDRLDAVIRERSGDVALDMSGVSFCDSTALHALVEARQRLLGLGRRLRVVAPSRSVDRLLWLSGLAELFYIPETTTGP